MFGFVFGDEVLGCFEENGVVVWKGLDSKRLMDAIYFFFKKKILLQISLLCVIYSFFLGFAVKSLGDYVGRLQMKI